VAGCPKLVLRYGAHAEKEYLQKLGRHFDAVHFNANLIEISKAATTSLIATIRSKHPHLGLFINPVTYLFGPYVQPGGGKVRRDLEWIKSFSKRTKSTVVKESYRALAGELGPSFVQAIEKSSAVKFMELTRSERDAICEGVVGYQRARLKNIIDSDQMEEFKDLVPGESIDPSALFAPYFYIADEWRASGVSCNIDLLARTIELFPNAVVHQMILISSGTLRDEAAIGQLVEGVRSSGAEGVWVWVSKFNEYAEPLESLRRMRAFVSELSRHAKVFMYAGGLWSMLLGHDGLAGVAHGVGYGEGRDVVSPMGAAAPTVRYYLPPLAKRVSIASIERCFSAMGVTTAQSFHDKVCDCNICRGVLGGELHRFSSFGEMHQAATSSRASQTPTAAKLCRFHFLLRRLESDRLFVNGTNATERSKALRQRAGLWSQQPTLKSEAGHLDEWCRSLGNEV